MDEQHGVGFLEVGIGDILNAATSADAWAVSQPEPVEGVLEWEAEGDLLGDIREGAAFHILLDEGLLAL